MGVVSVKEIECYYQHETGSQGRGSLLYIHGAGGDHQVWEQQMELGLNSYALDLPGHGQSGGTPTDSIEQYAAMVKGFVIATQLPRPLYLVGHSMGAAITLTCALDHSELLDGIILIGAGSRMKVLPSLLDDLSKGKSSPAFTRLGFSPQTPEAIVAPQIKSVGETSPALLWADFSACNNFDVSGELERLSLPALVIAGIDDKLTPPKLSQYITSHLQASRLEIIAAAGHFVMLEKPSEVNRLILDFCSGQK